MVEDDERWINWVRDGEWWRMARGEGWREVSGEGWRMASGGRRR